MQLHSDILRVSNLDGVLNLLNVREAKSTTHSDRNGARVKEVEGRGLVFDDPGETPGGWHATQGGPVAITMELSRNLVLMVEHV